MTPLRLPLPALLMLLALRAVACDPPTPIVTIAGISALPALACPGEELTFDGTASISGADGPITDYLWDFGDGTTTTGMVATHVFPGPGMYFVELTVRQGDTCESQQPAVVEVRVGTIPDFHVLAGSILSAICLGDTLFLDGQAGTEAVRWNNLPTGAGQWEGAQAIPDLGAGPTFSDTILFTQFLPGEAIMAESDFLGICVNMEHSFMGDLVVRITCPDGQGMVLHQQGGGGTYIGGAHDDDNLAPVPGTCWSYCWGPDAAWGTMAESCAYCMNPHVITGGTPPQDALEPGAYTPVQPFSNLLGCPLNGPWAISIEDLWANDNGFICDWWIDLRPGLSAGLLDFAPVIGFQDPDSAHWEGDGFVASPGQPAVGMAIPLGTGTYNYTFTITDNFGCTYDTSFVVMVSPLIQGPVEITGDAAACGNQKAVISAPDGFDAYHWSNGGTTRIQSVWAGTYTVEVAMGGCTMLSPPFEVHAEPEAEIPFIYWDNTALHTTDAAAYQWFLDGQAIPGANVGSWVPEANGLYTVQVIHFNGCRALSAPFTFTQLGVGTLMAEGLHLYPQPAQDLLFLSGAKLGSTYRLYDLRGQLLMEGLVTEGPQPIHVGNLAASLYVLELRYDQQAGRWPVIVE
ncbi:MAG TPA: PKD domain-containing protein [Flavobacteriales bacterium]|nr:PKD domain-containing protein [Flavobacteriales bacterium]